MHLAKLISDLGSFRKAARHLGLDQATISRRIRAVEDRIGIKLFVRSRAGVRLTPLGTQFIGEAALAISQLERAVENLGTTRSGRLRVGLATGFLSTRLDFSLRRYIRDYPEVSVTLQSGDIQGHLADLREGEVEVAILPGDLPFEGCRSWPLWRESLVVALPVHHPLAKRDTVRWDDLVDERFIITEEGNSADVKAWLSERLKPSHAKPTIVTHRVATTDLVSMVSMGFGLAVFCSSLRFAAPPDVVFKQLSDEFTWSVVCAHGDRNPVVARFVRALRADPENGRTVGAT